MLNEENKNQIAIFKALADPVRLEIIKYLKEAKEEVTCGEVGKATNISKTSGSYHFKLLQSAGLINARKDAREKYVSLNKSTFDEYITNFYENI
ncbi:hypothetical protein FC72_GL001465 [Companilactobacillus tucceti DSM 20183]|uniref:HTH arsR-type domain-containing protein n=1 Tax=Companilactobacillus tucceti DSM 20183 TaxID=1423811 RepID=A0A0R1IWV8_9LACO|nr:metalloregulator ArsR/SmtB family transcription factor [Companilactobacillus tucceti]KRK63558.1 hypothetical protein FC72_GL001465 [Companilactobacillus tucceti DSM 20183]